MTPTGWPCPTPEGGTAAELALTFDKGREQRLLIVPALFDEANRMRRFTVETMRRLDLAGIDTMLPDLPGCHESLQPLELQTIETWRQAVAAAASHFRASHMLGIRGGGLLVAGSIPSWIYAPTKGASILRQLVRSRILASREAGVDETQDALLQIGYAHGLELSGFRLGGTLLQELQKLAPDITHAIEHDRVGGSPLWLRAEPGEDEAQSAALAAILKQAMTS